MSLKILKLLAISILAVFMKPGDLHATLNLQSCPNITLLSEYDDTILSYLPDGFTKSEHDVSLDDLSDPSTKEYLGMLGLALPDKVIQFNTKLEVGVQQIIALSINDGKVVAIHCGVVVIP